MITDSNVPASADASPGLPHQARHGDLVVAAAAFALVAGGMEAATAGINVFVRQRIVNVSYDVAWMAPAAYLILFLPLALAFAAAAAVARRPMPVAWCVGIFGFLTAFSLLLPLGALAPWASALLAGGIALQLGRPAKRAPETTARLLRRGAAVLGALVLCAGAGVRGVRALQERRALAALPTWQAGAPNILLIVFDTVRRANLSLYGYARPTTPELERWARDGTVFDLAVATSPWTLPSHSTMFTGREPGELTADWLSPLSGEPRTLAEVLRSHGYRAGGFVANLPYAAWDSGLPRGFVHYDDFAVSLSMTLLHAAPARTWLFQRLKGARSLAEAVDAVRQFNLGRRQQPSNLRRPANSVTDAFLAWQPSADERPFFAFLNYHDAHLPYQAPAQFRRQVGGSRAASIDLYDGSIAYLDHEVGRLLDSLQERGVLGRTLVIVTADHGEQFGEHGLVEHANSLYLPLLRVPLILRFPPAVPAGRTVAELVSLRDLPSTVLDLARVRGGAGIPGASLARYWRDPSGAAPPMAVAEVSMAIRAPEFNRPNRRGPMSALLTEDWHYIRNGWGREQLYAYRSDSLELRNVVRGPALQDVLLTLRRQLDSALAAARAGQPKPQKLAASPASPQPR